MAEISYRVGGQKHDPTPHRVKNGYIEQLRFRLAVAHDDKNRDLYGRSLATRICTGDGSVHVAESGRLRPSAAAS